MRSDRDTIVAPATAPGGALAVVRVSGAEALACCDRIFRGRQPLSLAAGYTVHRGRIVDGGRTIDDVLATVFRAPRSYTGEECVEFSCHGSSYIVAEVLRLLLDAGCRTAAPGEFTLRAYLNGKMDLSQAEAVADLIASSSRAAHTLASTQMRGSYSAALDALRDELLRLTALLELELDFSEEEVEFADRGELRRTMERIGAEIDSLRSSFALGNALREGVAVAIVGAPNAGKSTLLNRLAGDDRAMVSEIAGTTRDVIEERVVIDGVLFRFLDTAGLRTTDDRLERMGIARTMEAIDRATVIIRLLDATALDRPATDTAGPDSFDSFDDPAADSAGPDRSATGAARIMCPTVRPSDSSDTHPTPHALDHPASGAARIMCPADRPTDSSDTSSAPHPLDRPASGAARIMCPADRPSDNSDTLPTPHVLDRPASGTARIVCPANRPTDSSDTHPTPSASDAIAGTGTTSTVSPASARTARRPELPAPDFALRRDQRLLTAINKTDLRPDMHLPADAIGISAREGTGIETLRAALRAAVDTSALSHGDAVVSHSRHYEALTAARTALTAALSALSADLPTDLLSEEIRAVIRALGSITSRGAIATDEVLGHIFSKFCIGK